MAKVNAWLEERCIAQWGQFLHGVVPGSVADASLSFTAAGNGNFGHYSVKT